MRINLAYPDAEFFSHTQNMPTPWLYWVHPLCKTRTSSSLCVGLYFQLSRENSLPFLPPDSCFCLSLSHACVLPLCLSAPLFPPSRKLQASVIIQGSLLDSCFPQQLASPSSMTAALRGISCYLREVRHPFPPTRFPTGLENQRFPSCTKRKGLRQP